MWGERFCSNLPAGLCPWAVGRAYVTCLSRRILFFREEAFREDFSMDVQGAFLPSGGVTGRLGTRPGFPPCSGRCRLR